MITVHTMGVHYRWLRAMPEQLTAQLRLAHDLREDLVTLQLEYEQAVKNIWSSYPEVADAEAARDSAEEMVAALAPVVKKQRSEQRSRTPKSSEAQALAAAKKELAAARQTRRDAIAAVKDEAKQRLQEASDSLKAAHKDLYRQYCTEGVLFWATFNDVLDHHKTAVKRIGQKRAHGQPATLRHHRWDGTGTIAVQLQRQANMPPRTPAVISDPNGKYRNVLSVPWTDPQVWDTMTRAQQRKTGRGIVRMRAGATRTPSGDCTPAWLDVPVQMHRMLPADADLTLARLTVKRTGSDLSATVQLTARVTDPDPIVDGPAIAIHIGWRAAESGTEVASWRSTEPLDIPSDLRHVIVADIDGVTGKIVIPHSITDRVHAHAKITAQRDQAVNIIRDQAVAYLTTHGPQPHPDPARGDITAADVKRWESPRRFAWLASYWRDTPPPAGAEIAAQLEAWRQIDKRLWDSSEHGRSRALGHRDDLHRNIAAVIAGQAGHVVVDDIDIAGIAAREVVDVPAAVETMWARRRSVASPGGLREKVVAAAVRDGVPLTVAPHKGLSLSHSCGHENPVPDGLIPRLVTCEGCGREYDVDRNATWAMLRAVRATSTA